MKTNIILLFVLLFCNFVSIYQLSAQNYNQMIKLVESDRQTSYSSTSANDNFGHSVAISGDYAIVGAPNEDENANALNNLQNAGAAYIFKRIGTAWTFQQKIVASDRSVNDLFGLSVSISGDYILVGASNVDKDANGLNPLQDAGAAYIFVRNGTIWSQQQKIVASDRATDDLFGQSVAISGDYIVIGVQNEDENASGGSTLEAAGSAYIFIRNGSTWSQQQKIVAATRAINDYFGTSVAINGDYVVIGALGDNYDASGGTVLDLAGAAYIFYRSGTNWSQQQKIVATVRDFFDFFGQSVAISANYIVVGALNESEDASGGNTLYRAGAAYIFFRNGATWLQQQKIVATDRGANDYFGNSVAINGDYIVIGATNEDEDANGVNMSTDAGSVYIFKRNGTTWSQQQKIVASDRGVSDYFGLSSAISGNYIIIGVPNEDEDANGMNPLMDAGSAYIFGDYNQLSYVTIATGNWNNPTIWQGGVVPPTDAIVTVRHTVNVTANTSCFSLKTETPTGILTVKTGVTFTVTH